jgi:transcriptional regulator with PAS, ATPase and Fis domain
MPSGRGDDGQPWVSCFLTGILISHLERMVRRPPDLDYAELFRQIEGIEPPSDPRQFLREATNWVPLAILRRLAAQCERLSETKDFAYQAGRSYFDPDREEALSIFKVIFRVLNDVRSVLVSSNLWAAVQASYLKLQSFEKRAPGAGLFMLSQFTENARPAASSIRFLQGIAEGFPRLNQTIREVRCTEEISQLRLEDLLRDFPGYAIHWEAGQATIVSRQSHAVVGRAQRVWLASETVAPPPEFLVDDPDAMVVAPQDGTITVLTDRESEPGNDNQAVQACRIVQPGTLTEGRLAYALTPGQIFDAPYSRFRIEFETSAEQVAEVTVDQVRREISALLFEHLKQIKGTHRSLFQSSVERRKLTLENQQLRQEVDRDYQYAGIVGHSPKMQQLFGLIRSIADTDVAVLIEGETGTGKELIARAIHNNGPRRAKRFVAVNCGALAETLLESELFGHEKGAFTGAVAQRRGVFEIADGGTLFLDEVGEVSPSTQIRLLRVLQEGEFHRVGGTNPIRVDVRVLSATNRTLEELVKEGRFRQDLYYRLNVFPLRVPPLRERREDIPLLVSHFLERSNRRLRKQVDGVSARAMAALMAYHWSGNVRELENIIQRMMIVAKDPLLDVEDLPGEIHHTEPSAPEKAAGLKDMARESAEAVERQAILDALSQTGGNVTRAAKLLGISRATLQKRMKAYGLRESRG